MQCIKNPGPMHVAEELNSLVVNFPTCNQREDAPMRIEGIGQSQKTCGDTKY